MLFLRSLSRFAMLLAPLLPMSSPSGAPRFRSRAVLQRAPVRSVDPVQQASQRRWLLSLWLVLGTLAVLCIPPLRGTIATGWTLPFWLIAAPAINLLAMAWARRGARRLRR